MRGIFLVNEGRLVGYQHPESLGKGGYQPRVLPNFTVSEKAMDYTMPACPPKPEKDFRMGRINLRKKK